MGAWVHELLYLGFQLALKSIVSMANLSASQALNSAIHLGFRVLNFPPPLSVNSILSFRFPLCAASQRGSLSMPLSLFYLFPNTTVVFTVGFSFLDSGRGW